MHFKRYRLLLAIVAFISIIFLILYNFLFENYEVIGESIECSASVPIPMNYTCKLDKVDNETQYWSFESEIPEGLQILNMMVTN